MNDLPPPAPPRVALGFDPGIKDPSALAIVEHVHRDGFDSFLVRHAQVIRLADKSLTGDEAADSMCLGLPLWDELAHVGVPWDITVVESQQAYRGAGVRASPEALILLAAVRGAAVRAYGRNTKVLTPKPQAWKGSVKKWIPQKRVCDALGWGHIHHETKDGGWCEPTGPGNWSEFGIKGSQWSHALDAIGLAIWGLRQTEGR